MCGRAWQCENAVGMMRGVVCGRASVRRASGAYVRCGMCTLGGPSVLIAGGLMLGSSRPRSSQRASPCILSRCAYYGCTRIVRATSTRGGQRLCKKWKEHKDKTEHSGKEKTAEGRSERAQRAKGFVYVIVKEPTRPCLISSTSLHCKRFGFRVLGLVSGSGLSPKHET